MNEESNFHTSIQDWILYTHNSATPIAPKELIAFVRARTGLTNAQCKVLISAFFSEIIAIFLQGKAVNFDELGNFHLAKNGRLIWEAGIFFKKRMNAIFKQES